MYGLPASQFYIGKCAYYGHKTGFNSKINPSNEQPNQFLNTQPPSSLLCYRCIGDIGIANAAAGTTAAAAAAAVVVEQQ